MKRKKWNIVFCWSDNCSFSVRLQDDFSMRIKKVKRKQVLKERYLMFVIDLVRVWRKVRWGYTPLYENVTKVSCESLKKGIWCSSMICFRVFVESPSESTPNDCTKMIRKVFQAWMQKVSIYEKCFGKVVDSSPKKRWPDM